MSFLVFAAIVLGGGLLFFIGYRVGSKRMEEFYSSQVRDIIVAALSSGLSGDEDGNN